MTNNDNGTTITDTGPGMGLDDMKRRPVNDHIFETTLTIEQCKRILTATQRHDVNFRALDQGRKAAILADMMKKDRWVWTDADPIRLHLHVPSGEVVCSDGQHRLMAALRSRRTLHTIVLWGDRWKAGVHVDRNRQRNVAQFLQHEHGLSSATVYVSATRLHLSRVLAATEGLTTGWTRTLVDDETVIDFVLKNQDTLRWAINHGAAATSRGFSMTGYLVFLFELSTISQDLADEFHRDFIDDALTPTDPLAQLRRSVARRFNDTGIRTTVPYTIANLVKAHNLRSAGEAVSKWVNVQSDDVTFPAGFKINGERVRSNNNG